MYKDVLISHSKDLEAASLQSISMAIFAFLATEQSTNQIKLKIK